MTRLSVRRRERVDAERARRAGRLLTWALQAVERDAPPPCSAAGLDDLAERAAFHRVAPLLHLSGRRLDSLPRAVAEQLRSDYHAAVHRHVFVLDDLRWIEGAWSALDAPWLVVKGPVLSEVVYRRPDHRSYGDLDLVVPGDALGPAVDLLRAAGAALVEADWDTLVADRHGELQLVLPSGTVLDLHWHLVPIGSVRDRFTIPMHDLFRRSRPVDLAGRPYRTLSVADTIVHLALHGVLSGGNRLGWLKDLEQAIASQSPDWPAVTATARAWGASPALAVQLRRGRRLLGNVVPDEALASVADERTWPAVVLAADRLQPLERATGRRSLPRLLAWSTAATAARSGLALAGASGGWTSRRLQADARPVVPSRATTRPSAEAWKAYLAMAAAGAGSRR